MLGRGNGDFAESLPSSLYNLQKACRGAIRTPLKNFLQSYGFMRGREMAALAWHGICYVDNKINIKKNEENLNAS